MQRPQAPQAHGWASPLPAETPECKAKSTVGIQADGDLPGRVQLTLQLDGSTESIDCSMRHLQSKGRQEGAGTQGRGTAVTSFGSPNSVSFIVPQSKYK